MLPGRFGNFAVPQFFTEGAHLLQDFVSPGGFLGIHARNGESHMYQHVVPDVRFGHEIETDVAGDAAERHASYGQPSYRGFSS